MIVYLQLTPLEASKLIFRIDKTHNIQVKHEHLEREIDSLDNNRPVLILTGLFTNLSRFLFSICEIVWKVNLGVL